MHRLKNKMCPHGDHKRFMLNCEFYAYIRPHYITLGITHRHWAAHMEVKRLLRAALSGSWSRSPWSPWSCCSAGPAGWCHPGCPREQPSVLVEEFFVSDCLIRSRVWGLEAWKCNKSVRMMDDGKLSFEVRRWQPWFGRREVNHALTSTGNGYLSVSISMVGGGLLYVKGSEYICSH